MIARWARLLRGSRLATAIALLAVLGAPAGLASAQPVEPSAKDRWRTLTPSPLERTEVGAARIGRHAYVVGGFLPSRETTGRMVRYDLKRDRWKEVASPPIAVNHPAVTAHRGRLYLSGGFQRLAEDPSARLYRYNPNRDRWKRLADSSVPRGGHAIEGIGGKLYAAAGEGEADGALRTLEIYNLRTGKWRSGPDLEVGRNHVASTVLNRRLYVLGGRAPGGNLKVVERYNPKRKRWGKAPALRTIRSGFAAVTARGRIVAFGGEELSEGDETIAEVEMFDSQKKRWTDLPEMRTPRHGLGGVVRRDRVLALEGGPTPGFDFSAAAEFLDVSR